MIRSVGLFPPSAPKFIRRPDLTRAVRVAIVLQAHAAQLNQTWGAITDLSRQYAVSRPFIYGLLSTFEQGIDTLFFPTKPPTAPAREASEQAILAYRFEGKCSIDAISTLMKRSGMPYSSTGYLSQFLSEVGHCLPDTLENTQNSAQLVVFASDEVFAKSIPLLITVEPISSAILRIELADQRTSAIWSAHWQALQANGFEACLLTSDAGSGLCAAHQAVLSDTPWQLDTFHGIAHRLGDYARRLEKSAYAAITAVEKREAVLATAKSAPVIDKRLALCFEAETVAEQAIDLYDNFSYLYRTLTHQLNLFDVNGALRHADHAVEQMKAALALMVSLNHAGISQVAVSIENALPDLLVYFNEAIAVVENCRQFTDNPEALKALCLAWQWDKRAIKSKVTARKKRAIEQRQFYLEWAELWIGEAEKYSTLKAKVMAELDTIVQASSMVECINSILRPYLDASKNQVTQAFLNTFMFYHNHRRYHAGKRKGKTPMEILTGQQQTEDWLTLLLQSVNENRPPLAA